MKNHFFQNSPLFLIDAGARRGIENHWSFFKDTIRVSGFEPDQEECKRLNVLEENKGLKYYPFALDSQKGEKEFYITNNPSSCGFYPVNSELMNRFVGGKENLSILKTTNLHTTTVDLFIKENNLPYPDFIKLDTEGSELDILKGALESIEKSVLGISVEVEFLEMHSGQPLFSDIDIFLRKKNFSLYELKTNKIEKAVLPSKETACEKGSPAPYGQIVSGEAIYLRDAVYDISKNYYDFKWDKVKIIKLAAIMELFNHNDSSIELLKFFSGRGIIEKKDAGIMIDLLTPFKYGKELLYDEYMSEYIKYANVNCNKRKHKILRKIIPKSLKKKIRASLIKAKNIIDRLLY